jgi:hypothetical protein
MEQHASEDKKESLRKDLSSIETRKPWPLMP